MKNIRTYLAAALLGMMVLLPVAAQNSINLTPRAKSVEMGTGSIRLAKGFKVDCAGLPDSIAAEAIRFVKDINAATGLKAKVTGTTQKAGNKQNALVRLAFDDKFGPEAYQLAISPKDIRIKAHTTSGFFYAFQTLKKMLPANVLAGTMDKKADYALPIVSIDDEPRFGYRGFMLDVSRHFFTLDELKRMIDVMAVYKMNVFHWHLTDDQGWRAEIKKYPRLTEVGSVAAKCRLNDMKTGPYWTEEPYGPYFYTQDQMRELVAYAKERHIEVLPEVDMPGHFCAAMASYPEYSCTPNGTHEVATHQGGVWDDVMNVANPKAVQFAKDILTELMDIFPYPYIHIGGDECPTKAWEQNDECQQRKEQLGLKSYRELQTRFIKEMSDHVRSHGKSLIVWNESVTAGGADLDLMATTGATVMSWHPCQAGARKAAELGLNTIITEYHTAQGGYYINRKQSADPDEPQGAGAGDDTVEGCYNYVPVPANVPADLQPRYKGVQATFWTEWVSDRQYLEYLALPRLIAVAEAGWTQQSDKDFEDFRSRMIKDRVWLDMKGYEYGKKY